MIQKQIIISLEKNGWQISASCEKLKILVLAKTSRQAMVKFANALKMVKKEDIEEALNWWC